MIAICSLGSCATSHVIRWSQGRDSLFEQPAEKRASYTQPTSILLSLPIAFVWDVGTFPFQWLWSVYPFGPEMSPQPRVDGVIPADISRSKKREHSATPDGGD